MIHITFIRIQQWFTNIRRNRVNKKVVQLNPITVATIAMILVVVVVRFIIYTCNMYYYLTNSQKLLLLTNMEWNMEYDLLFYSLRRTPLYQC